MTRRFFGFLWIPLFERYRAVVEAKAVREAEAVRLDGGLLAVCGRIAESPPEKRPREVPAVLGRTSSKRTPSTKSGDPESFDTPGLSSGGGGFDRESGGDTVLGLAVLGLNERFISLMLLPRFNPRVGLNARKRASKNS